MAIGSRLEYQLTFVKKLLRNGLPKAFLNHFLPSFYILAAQFIYSRRDKPVVEPVDECDYEDLKESSDYLLNHQRSGFDQGIVKIVCISCIMINNQFIRIYQFHCDYS